MLRLAHVLSLLCLPLAAADYYVSPSGNSGNSGSIGSPWTLASVCASGNPKSLAAGDVVHLRAGTYDQGGLICYGNGSAGNPITYQNYAGEVATIDYTATPSGDMGAVISLHPDSSYLRWRRNPAGGWLIVQVSETTRIFAEYASCYPACRPDGVRDYGDGNELRELIIQNVGVGITSQGGACGGHYIGNILRYNGWESGILNVGNDFYLQQGEACATEKIIEHTVYFNSWQYPQAQGSSGSFVRGITFRNNVGWNHGQPATDADGSSLLIGGIGTAAVEDVEVTGNVMFSTYANTRQNLLRFYDPTDSASAKCSGCTVSNNYIRALASGGGNALQLPYTMTGLTETGNVFVGPTANGSAAGQFPNSTFLASENTDRVYEYSLDSRRVVVLVDGDGSGAVNYTPTCAGTLPLRDAMSAVTAGVEHTLPCGSASSVTMTYSGTVQPIVGNAPNAPTHPGSAIRVLIGYVEAAVTVPSRMSGGVQFSGGVRVQ